MKTRNQKTSIAIALVAAIALLATAAVAQASTNKGAMTKGSKWIAKTSKSRIGAFPGIGFRADAISALAAARKAGSGQKTSADDSLVTNVTENAADYATTAGSNAKLILAAVVAGKQPRCFGDVDLVGQLNTFYESTGKRKGQYGDTAYDQALAMLALKAAHLKVPKAAIKFARDHRGGNGWNFALSADKGDDVEATGLMIEALRAAGVSKKDKALKTAFTWMYNQRNNMGGFDPAVEQGSTNANTTAYAIRAGSAMGKNLKKSKAALRALQTKQGWFRLTITDQGSQGIATTDSVIALSGRSYPIVVRKSAAKACS